MQKQSRSPRLPGPLLPCRPFLTAAAGSYFRTSWVCCRACAHTQVFFEVGITYIRLLSHSFTQVTKKASLQSLRHQVQLSLQTDFLEQVEANPNRASCFVNFQQMRNVGWEWLRRENLFLIYSRNLHMGTATHSGNLHMSTYSGNFRFILFKRVTKTERIFHFLVHSPSDCIGQDWARLKPRARNVIWPPTWWQEPKQLSHQPPLLPPTPSPSPHWLSAECQIRNGIARTWISTHITPFWHYYRCQPKPTKSPH